MNKFLLISFLASFWLWLTPQAMATRTVCTLIVDVDTGDTVYQEGTDCEVPYSPASTFKIAIALMGYDTGLLIDTQTPIEPYKPVYRSGIRTQRQNTSPTTWLKHSVPWYSQLLTTRMREKVLKDYTGAFDYGNKDLSGDPGESNGLTRSWQSSSLQITPKQQINFLRKLLKRDLPVSDAAMQNTIDIVPFFQRADSWLVHGKTGTVFLLDEAGELTDIQAGWFVGWATRQDETLVFARLILDDAEQTRFAGGRAQNAFLTDFDKLASNGFSR